VADAVRAHRRHLPDYRARDLMKLMAEAAWQCGDPGLQYDSTINDCTPARTPAAINASNPCVTGDTLVATANGWRRIDETGGLFGRNHRSRRSATLRRSDLPNGDEAGSSVSRTRAGYEFASLPITRSGRSSTVTFLSASSMLAIAFGWSRRVRSAGRRRAIGGSHRVAVGDGCLVRSAHRYGSRKP